MSAASPYPGLRPFQHEESHLFFGREAQVEDMLARLETHRFLAVVGASGCGKSSLVRAGLIPALEQGFLSDARPNWRIAVARPGGAPFDNLAASLLQDAALGPERREDHAGAILEATLRRGPLGLVEAVAESNLPEGTNLLLLVDQFEELFRYRQQAANPDDVDAFVSLLLAAAQSRPSAAPIYVVITMRSDFIGDCALFTGLPEAINDSQFLTPRLSRDQYRAAIVEPARVADGQLSSALVNRLLNDLRGEPDQLPILQHALMRMWTQASDNDSTQALTLDDYASIGGLAEALSDHCDEILNETLNADQRRIAEVMFRALCERGSDQRDTRRPVQLGTVAAIAGVGIEAVQPVVDAFRGEGRNFLMPPAPTPLEATTTLDISHESLIRCWQTLNKWVVTEAESARQYQRLEDAAQRRQRRQGELWRGVDLLNAQRWKEKQGPTRDWAKRYGDAYLQAMIFLAQSEAAEKGQQQRQEQERQQALERARELAETQKARADEQAKAAKRFQWVAGVIGVLLLVMIGVAIYAQYQRSLAAQAQERAEREKQQAEHERQRAQQEEQNAKRAAEAAKRHQERAEVRLAHYLAAASRNYATSEPQLSVLLSLEALKTRRIPAAQEALRHSLANIGGIPLAGHQGAVYGVAFSPDGMRLASASTDNTVRIWNPNDPQAEPATFRGHQGAVYGVAFSPDGMRLASASTDNTVRIWNPNNPQAEPTIFRGHQGDVTGVAFSPDGMRLASASTDNTVRIWNPNDPQAEPAIFRGHQGAVTGVAFSPDGMRLASASTDNTVRIWNPNDPQAEPAIFRGHQGAVTGVAFSPDGMRLASASWDDTVRVWNPNDPQAEPAIFRGHQGAVTGVAFSPDGMRLASASWDDTVRVWNPNNPQAEPAIFRGHQGYVTGVAFSPDGMRLASASTDNTVRVWNPNNPQAEPATFRGHQGDVTGVAFSPDGMRLASAGTDNTVRIWNPNDPQAEPTIFRGHQNYVTGVAFSPDGMRLASAGTDNTVRFWNPNDPQAEPAIFRGHQGAVTGVAFSPDGMRLASASTDNTVRVWNPNNPQAEPAIFRGHQGDVYGVAFSPDGMRLASASTDNTVRIWNPNDPQAEPATFRGHQGAVTGVAFSPDGMRLASASTDNTVRIWNPNDPQAEPAIFRGHQDYVTGVAFSPDGMRLASASWDDTVRVWNPNDPQAEPAIFRGHQGYVTGVAFSPDGMRLASASTDNTVRIWNAILDELIDFACHVIIRNFSKREWRLFQANEPYRRTCRNCPLAREFINDIAEAIAKGLIESEKAVSQVNYALQNDSETSTTTREEAEKLIAPALMTQGLEQAKEGKIENALTLFNTALGFDQTLGTESNYAEAWNSLCWFGAVNGYADRVLAACQTAVNLVPDNGGIRDSRGVALALDWTLHRRHRRLSTIPPMGSQE